MGDLEIIQKQVDWIESGKIGCVFASALVKQREKIGWQFIVNNETLVIPDKCLVLSLLFTEKNIEEVKQWAIDNGMYLDSVDDLYNGLRIKLSGNVSWVQYFGKDSHVKTRQAPYSMLSFSVKLPKKYYFKVGWDGILHLAHASVQYLSNKAADTLWNQSIIKTKKELGHSPTIEQAAKTTFKK